MQSPSPTPWQTGCATDGRTIFTNGINWVELVSEETLAAKAVPPTGGRAAALSADKAVAATGAVLKEIDLGPVWSGPSVSCGRVCVGTGDTLFTPSDFEAFFPKKYTGVRYCFGLPGEDELSRLGAGKE